IDLNPAGREQTKKRRPTLPMCSALVPWIATVKSGPLVHFRGTAIAKINKSWRGMTAAAAINIRRQGARAARSWRRRGNRSAPAGVITTAARNAAAIQEIVPYTVRHTIGTEMAARGVPALEIAGFLGHDMPNMKTTSRYIKVRPEYLRHALEA